MAYDLDFTLNWLNKFGNEIIEQKQYISELDAAIGDADHGFNMAKGVEAFRASIEKTPAKDPSDAFMKLAMAMLSKVGGSSGPLYGTAFMKMSTGLKGKVEFSIEDFAKAVALAFEGIKARGQNSQEGEKTMDDVWGPVSRDLASNCLTIEKIDSYVEKTKPMKATKGRASYLGDNSIGHIDPGAYTSGIFFKTFLKTE